MPMRQWRTLLACLLTLSASRAAPPLAAGGPATYDEPFAHAWFVVPEPSGPDGTLLHLGPRLAPEPHVATGSAKLVTLLPTTPEALAAWERSVYLVFPPAQPSPAAMPRRSVLRITAAPSIWGATWTFDTNTTRLHAEPAIPGSLPLLSIAASPWGLAALLQTAHGATLCVRTPAGWSTLDLPPRAEGARWILADESGLLLASAQPHTPLWRAALERNPNAPELLSATWSEQFVQWPTPAAEATLLRASDITILAQRTEESPARLNLWRISEAAPRLIQSIDVADAPFAVAGMDDAARLAILSVRAGDSARAADRARPSTRLVEVSARTGTILSDAPLSLANALTGNELRLIAVGAVAAMSVIGIAILRPRSEHPPLSLPRGWSLASPLRRSIAGAIDAFAALALAGALTGVPIPQALSASAWFTEPDAWRAPIAAAAIGLVASTLLEGVFSRTPGKALCGCRVVRVAMVKSPDGMLEPRPLIPGLRAAFVRNLYRWLLAPIAAMSLGSSDGRHRGDILARTVVLVRDDAPPE